MLKPIVIVGSIHLHLVFTAARLPQPGETLPGAWPSIPTQQEVDSFLSRRSHAPQEHAL
jgi:hypothetical protein